MSNIIPKLNLNQHPKDVVNNSLVDAVNIMMSKDGTTLQTECGIDVFNNICTKLNKLIKNIYDSNQQEFTENYKIVHCCPCNEELLIFVYTGLINITYGDYRLLLFRYNEKLDHLKLINEDIEYYNGNLITTFTYNKEELILAISECNGDKDMPLRVINLGKYENEDYGFNTATNHPICPEVLIPNILTNLVSGNAYKGWYYIFIRYKLTNNNYTQWFNTNETVYVDNSTNNTFISLYAPINKDKIELNTFINGDAYNKISDGSDIASLSFNCEINGLDSKYEYYDLGFICVSKTYTKCFIINDIEIKIKNIIFDTNVIKEYSIDEMLKSYTNYYNVKTLETYNNRLYIGNYKENIIEKKDLEELKKIDVNIKFKYEDIKLNINNITENFYVTYHATMDSSDKTSKETLSTKKDLCVYKNLKLENLENLIDTDNKDNDINIETEQGITKTIKFDKCFPINSMIGFKGFIEYPEQASIESSVITPTPDTDRPSGDDTLDDNFGNKDDDITNTQPDQEHPGGSNNGVPPSQLPSVLDSIINIDTTSIETIKLGYYDDEEKNIIYLDTDLKTSEFYFIDGYYYLISTSEESNKLNCKIIKDKNDEYLDLTKPLYIKYRTTIGELTRFNIITLKTHLYYNHNVYSELYKDNGVDILTYIHQWIEFSTSYYANSLDNNINVLNNISILPNEYYNFYVHFVDKYGYSTDGIQLKHFNLNLYYIHKDIETKYESDTHTKINPLVDTIKANYVRNNNDDVLIYPYLNFENTEYFETFALLKATFSISEIPKNYIGYFITYEKLEKTILGTAVLKFNNENKTDGKDLIYTKSIFNLYNDKFNYEDKININFNKLERINGGFTGGSSGHYVSYNKNFAVSKILSSVDILNLSVNNAKVLKVADNFDNLLKSTNIELLANVAIDYDNNKTITEEYIDSLRTSIDSHVYKLKKEIKTVKVIENGNTEYKLMLYLNKNKQLIPCTKINYNTNEIILNTKNCFITQEHAIIFKENVFFNNTIKSFQYLYDLYNYQDSNNNIANNPLTNYKWYYWSDTYNESISYNNKPIVVFFPAKIQSSETDNSNYYQLGYVVEAKNTIDLYQQTKTAIYDLYPKIYTAYNEDIKYETNFTKTIRRSNYIQDESDKIGWRIFESNNYVNIKENKGNIVKVTGIGTLMLVHTEHSLFVFNDTNTIKATESDIQLGNIDIWDIKYKELISSKLGYAGIKDEQHAIVGSFGYIFYDFDGNCFYRFDNSKLDKIDESINNYLDIFKYDVNKQINLIDDFNNNRILIGINAIDKNAVEHKLTLSYNYKTNNFISKHNYLFKGFSTKNNTYLLSYNQDIYNKICKFIETNSQDYYNKAYIYPEIYTSEGYSKISIITNLSYENIKFLNAIKYKIRNLDKVYNLNNIEPINGVIKNAGDIIRIYSEYCDTGNIDVSKCNDKELIVSKDGGNFNKFNDYKIPVFRLGNWHFNGLKDRFAEYLKGNANYDEMSDIYGNWFVVTFIFNRHEIVEIESLDYKTTNDINK